MIGDKKLFLACNMVSLKKEKCINNNYDDKGRYKTAIGDVTTTHTYDDTNRTNTVVTPSTSTTTVYTYDANLNGTKQTTTNLTDIIYTTSATEEICLRGFNGIFDWNDVKYSNQIGSTHSTG